ncbi:MAG: S8 family serine peptidase [Bacteroidota bacterium]
MLPRNATILLGILLCLAQTLHAQNYYHSPNGIIDLNISNEKILVKFKSTVGLETQNQILDAQDDFLKLETQLLLPAPQVRIIDTENIQTDADVNTLLQNIKANENVAYAHHFYTHTDGTFSAVTDQVLLRLINLNQLSTIEQILFNDFVGVASYLQNPFDPYLLEITVSDNNNALTLANQLHESGLFQSAEPNFLKILKPFNTNDPSVNAQWSLRNDGQNTAAYGGIAGADMNVFEAWNIATGSASIKVAIIDEGVDLTHPDLLPNLLPGFDATGQGSAGAPAGDDAHGTACAGIVAAAGNNNLGGAGVAYDCKIIPVRIGYGAGNAWVTNSTWIANGINWAWQNGAADVLSNSWGGGSASFVINAAIDGAVNNGRGGLGTPVLFAAGNDNSLVSYPAAYEPTIAVVAMSMCHQRKSPTSCDNEYWWGSNYGNGADVAAPGVKIFTTDIAGGNGYTTGDYTNNFNGTSSACPNAAGVMALILSHDPSLTADEARYALESTTDKVGGYNYTTYASQPNGTWSPELGYGKINAAAALGGNTNPPPPPAATNDAGITGINTPTGMVCYNSVSPEVILKNFGTNTLTSVTITYGVNGAINNTFNWTGSLASNATAIVTLDNISFTNGNSTMTATTSYPNMQVDDNPSNDSFSNSFLSQASNLTMNLTFDNFPNQTSWEIKNTNGSTVAAGGNYSSSFSNNTITEEICLDDGCYELTVFDSQGNGMCCLQGQGNFSLTENSTGTTLATGGQFTNAISTSFCIPSSMGNPLTVSIGAGNNVSCFGANDGWITVVATGGTGSYTYLWDHGATGATANNLGAGNYAVTVSDGVSTTSLSISISQPPALNISILQTDPSPTGNNNGTLTAVGSGGVAGFSYLWSTGQASPTINNLSAGTYTVTVTDASSCSAVKTVSLGNTGGSVLAVEVLYITDISCFGASDGAAMVAATGGNGNYTYQWSNGMIGENVNDLAVGTHVVTATDGNFSGTATVQIQEPPLLSLQLSRTNVTNGNNGSATAIVQGGTPNYFYDWSNGATTATIQNLSAGIYTVTVTDMNDCQQIDQIEIINITPSPSGYCPSSGLNATNEWIDFVKFATISHFSGNDEGYGDHTTYVAELEQNSLNPILLVPGFLGPTYEEVWKVWIDFNRDFDFDDPGETVFQAGPTTTAVNGFFTIPPHVPIGLTRMRISMKWQGVPTACENFEFGEVEDYAVFIMPNSGQSTCPLVHYNTTDFEAGWGIWQDGGADCRRDVEDAPYANSGSYCVRLRDDSPSAVLKSQYLGLADFSGLTISFSFITKNMQQATDHFSLEISRDGGQSFETLQAWFYQTHFENGERHQEEITVAGAFVDATVLRFKCNAAEDENWLFLDDIMLVGCSDAQVGNVVTVNHSTSETESSTSAEVGDTFLEWVKIYPSPAEETLNVGFYATKNTTAQVSILNMAGQEIHRAQLTLEKNKYLIPIDVSRFDSGIYFLKIAAAAESVVKKFMVKR